jgi:DnaJ-class molecular chaperone
MSVTSDAYPCSTCGVLIWQGQYHACGGTPTYAPAPSWTIQRCPVCEGRGNVPAGFYDRLVVSTAANAEQCHTCDGRGMLRVGVGGTVEKVI